jgi:hypothetical protein
VFTLPAAIADIAYQNKAVIYDILFTTSAETMTTIAVDPKHLGARVGITSVLHTWGSALTHHPHVHMIVLGGGISIDGERWVACRPGFFLPVRRSTSRFTSSTRSTRVPRGCASCSGIANSTHKASPHVNDRSAARNVHLKAGPRGVGRFPAQLGPSKTGPSLFPDAAVQSARAFAVNGEVLRPHLSSSGRLGSLLL